MGVGAARQGVPGYTSSLPRPDRTPTAARCPPHGGSEARPLVRRVFNFDNNDLAQLAGLAAGLAELHQDYLNRTVLIVYALI